MKAVAYIRVSTEEQVFGTSLESQEKACIEFANKNGLDLPKENIFREEGESAKMLDRTQLQNMLAYVKNNRGKIDYCIVWKVDRLARKSEYHHAIKAILLKYGVKLKSVTEPIDESPMGSLMEGVLAAFAQFDNDIRTTRTVTGMRARTMQGGWPHRATYGYRNTKTPAGVSTIAPDDNAERAKKLLETFATGAYSLNQAVTLAKKLGIRSTLTGKPYGWQGIKNILLNPLYAGFIYSSFTDGAYITAIHKPLVRPVTHYKIKAIVDGKNPRQSRHAKDDWPLRGGFLKCIYCKHPLTGGAPKGRNRHYPRYSCPKCRVSVEVKATSRDRDDTHAKFMALLAKIKPREEVAKAFREIVLRKWNDEYKDAVDVSRRIDKDMAALQQKKSRVIDLFIETKLTDEEKDHKLKEIQDDMGDLELQRIDAGSEVTNKEQIVDSAVMFLTHADQFWNLGNLEVRKGIQDLIFPEGLYYSFVDGFGTIKLSQSHLLIEKVASKDDLNPNLVTSRGIEPLLPG
jgi:site-specific DNA recombinase